MHLLVFSPYYPPHTGGLESHSEEFNIRLSAAGTSITVFTPRLPGDASEHESKNEHLRIIRFPAFEIIPNYPLPKFWQPTFWKLWKEVSVGSHDLVLSRTRFFFTSLMAWRHARRRNLPWIHIEHGSSFVKLSGKTATFLAWIYDLTLGRAIFRNSDQNVSVSEAARKFVNRFDQRPSPVIYRGLDFTAIDQVKNARVQEDAQSKVKIVTAARLYKWKGIEDTIALIKKLPLSNKQQVVFYVIGEGSDYDRLKKLAAGEPIRFLGKMTRPETIAWLKTCDIYVHSSHPGGGLSTSLLEAMYCKCAVIATPHEGASEILHNDNGLLSDPLSIENLISLIEDEGLRKKLADQAQTDVATRFAWDANIQKYLVLLKQYT